MKKTRNRIYPKLVFIFVAMKRNIRELLALIGLGKELGIETIVVTYLTVHGERIREESLFYHQEIANKIFREAKEKANSLDISLVLPKTFRVKHNDTEQDTLTEEISICEDPWSFLMVDNNGDIKPCCYSTIPLGNVEKEKLLTIWNNNGFQKLRKSFEIEDASGDCLTCNKNNDINIESTHIHIV